MRAYVGPSSKHRGFLGLPGLPTTEASACLDAAQKYPHARGLGSTGCRVAYLVYSSLLPQKSTSPQGESLASLVTYLRPLSSYLSRLRYALQLGTDQNGNRGFMPKKKVVLFSSATRFLQYDHLDTHRAKTAHGISQCHSPEDALKSRPN